MRNPNLNGNVPDKSAVALLLIDVINDFNFEDGEKLFAEALKVAANIAILKNKARTAGVPVIYVNDNFGKWHSNFRAQLEHCLGNECKGREIANAVRPDDNDYFVLKTLNSGFYCTVLEVLLRHIQAHTLILAGVAGNVCVQYTAGDAYMRQFELIVAADATASNTAEENHWALLQMAKYLHVDVRQVGDINFEQLLTRPLD